jgi:hypothetical protein
VFCPSVHGSGIGLPSNARFYAYSAGCAFSYFADCAFSYFGGRVFR